MGRSFSKYMSFQDKTTERQSPNPINQSVADHAIFWLEEQSQSSSESQADPLAPKTVQPDDVTFQVINQLKDGMKSRFSNNIERVRVFHDLHSCCQQIEDKARTEAIFLVTSDSSAESILTHFRGTQNFIQSLYVLIESGTNYTEVISGYGSQGIPVQLVDACKSLPIRILHDISKYYFSKGVHQEKDGSATAARDALSYFGFAKQAEAWANRLAGVVHRGYLDEIEDHINQGKEAMARGQTSDDGTTILRQQEVSGSDGDPSSTMRTFIVGLDKVSVQLDSDITRVIRCINNDELILIVSGLDRSTPILVVSSEPVPTQVTAHCKLVHHCCFLHEAQPASIPKTFVRDKSNVYSMDQLMTELHHKLGQHYQNCAVRESFEKRDQRKAKGFLEKAKQCYDLLERETEKAMKRYAELLKKTSA